MTERKEAYMVAFAPPPDAYHPTPDTVLTALEAIRALCDQELARIERDGGCSGFAERVRAEVGRVLR